MISRKINRINNIIKDYISTEREFRRQSAVSINQLFLGSNQIASNRDADYQKKVLKRISSAYNNSINGQIDIDEKYRPGAKWKPQILEKRLNYINALRDSNIPVLAELFSNFFRNSGAVSILKKTLYPEFIKPLIGNTRKKRFLLEVLKDINTWKDYFKAEDINELKLPNEGNPFGYLIDNIIVTGSSCSLNYYAKKLFSLIKNIKEPIVAEIGGGFGGLMFYLFMQTPNITCLNFDLPEIIVIAQYYLMMAFPEKRFLLYGEPGSEGAISKMQFDGFDAILLPNFKLPDLDDLSIDAFYNIHSLSEMDFPTIEEYIQQIGRTTRKYFFHENSVEKRNIGYGFEEVPSDMFLIRDNQFKLIYKTNAIWNEPRYCEYLYSKIMRK